MHIIAVAAGKGGVGKSTVCASLAFGLKKLGYLVGVLDADIYGPSMGRMIPEEAMPVVSMAHYNDSFRGVRAPIANNIVRSFLDETDWGELDFLLIDFPPGTGDIQLTLLQGARLSGALLVTTPQMVAVEDVIKAGEMFHDLAVPIFGVIENMSHFEGREIFGRGGGEKVAKALGCELLGQIPLDPEVARASDQGKMCGHFEDLAKQARRWTDQVSKEIVQVEVGKDLVVVWNDGSEVRVPASDLQALCPCVRCREGGVRVDSDVYMKKVERVGRYGLKLSFSSGCSSGVYPTHKL